MFKIIRSPEKTDSQSSRDARSDVHSCQRCGEGKFSGKSATAGPNPPIRRRPK